MKSKEEQLTEELKIVKLTLQTEKAKNKSLQRQNRSLESRLGTGMKQSEALKAACSVLKKTEGLNRTIAREPIRRHQYSVDIVSLSVESYVRARCGFRGAVDMLSHMNESFGWKLKKVPNRNGIENRLKKSGYSICKEPAYAGPEEEHAQTTDEGMMPGSDKMLPSLGVNAEKKSDVPLRRSDVRVSDISVASGWNGTGIRAVLAATEKKEGKPPPYVISDNDTKLNGAIRESNCVHVRDIGHTMALPVERQYGKDKRFKACTKAVAGVKVREAMRETGCLLPPRQRTVARLMNLSQTVGWSKNMQRIFASPSANGKQTLDFVNTHGKTTGELNCIPGFVNHALKLIRSEGMSKKSIDACLKGMDKMLKRNNRRINRFKLSVRQYLERERDRLANEKSVWNASSDIIESLFGCHKFKRSRNPLHGVTACVLILPTRTGDGGHPSAVGFKRCLEGVFMKDLESWTKDSLTDNLAVKRRKKLAG
ncbi:hypothetical protein Barb7_00809 [Bacteroidales bacterium Barb7]|nr:hypothetical protein Barb7_00809 [Bacteroidales bacterium Barb7]